MIKITLATTIIFLCAVTAASAERPSDLRLVDGLCDGKSHIAEGQIGTDLTRRQSRFYCDAMFLTTFGSSKDHTLVQFAEKEAHHGQIIGYAGMMVAGQNILNVDHVYLAPRTPTAVNQGLCKFFYTATRLSSIFCGAIIDDGNRRTSIVVSFEVTRGQ